MERKIFREQTDWEELSSEEKKIIKKLSDSRIVAYFSRQTPPLSVKKFRNDLGAVVWKKKLKDSTSTNTTTTTEPTPPVVPPPVVTLPDPDLFLAKYVGKYKGSGILPDFEVIEKFNKLFVKNLTIGEVELEYVSENKFKGEIFGTKADLEFKSSGDKIIGGVVTASGMKFNFSREGESGQVQQQTTTSTQSQSQQAGQNQNSFEKIDITGEDILNGGKLVKKYMRGYIVTKIQEYLSELGFNRFSNTGVPDGFYGDQTEKEVIRYQKGTNGDLNTDGIVNDKTWARLVKDVTEKEKKEQRPKIIPRPIIPGEEKIINVNEPF